LAGISEKEEEEEKEEELHQQTLKFRMEVTTHNS
jgi:hypothetical protein